MSVELKIPEVGESISEVQIAEWLKSEGERVEKDENVAVIETDKATLELPAPVSGTLTRIIKRQGDQASVGDVIGEMAEEAATSTARAEAPRPKPAEPPTPAKAEAARMKAAVKPQAVTRPGREPEQSAQLPERKPSPTLEALPQPEEAADGRQKKGQVSVPEQHAAPQPALTTRGLSDGRQEESVAMSPLRRRIAARLVEAQHAAALLTTFNEIDMSPVIALRRQYQELFQQKHKVRLGFMSFFVKASVEALKYIPQVNAEIRGSAIVYRNYYDIGVAVGGGKGLVVPVLRSAERMSFAEIEAAIADFARRAEQNKLTLEELEGGTFTISNGGIYGSLLSTPIINPPQSGILGMHAIQDRPVARDGAVEVRPMMYVALTYDHRIIDGREAVTFLKRIKELIEDPARLLLEV